MAGITVRDIAKQICRPGESLTSVVDRLRNWTDEGLLIPLGDKNPGTGKRRIYPTSVLVDALILSVLTDAVGMNAVKGASFGKLFKIAKTQLLTSKAPGQRFLAIGLSREGNGAEIGTSSADGLAGLIGPSPHESHVVIDLWKLNQRLNMKETLDG